MHNENLIQFMIYLHTGTGGIALASGLGALISRKGHTTHRKAGRLFFYTMLTSAVLAMVITCLPGHRSPLLFAIGLFSSYLIISGYRSVRLKTRDSPVTTDKMIALVMIMVGTAMIVVPVAITGNINWILLVFGLIGIAFAVRDLMIMNEPEKLVRQWKQLHLGKMTGGYIAAVTAFFVVNEILPGLWAWFTPTVLGTLYIVYWSRRINPLQHS